jgi:hypothetical protein
MSRDGCLLLVGIAVGAGLMYVFEPRPGVAGRP